MASNGVGSGPRFSQSAIQTIVSFAADYVRDCLDNSWFKRESLEKDWWGGLQLLLRHSFFQGRTDEVSQKVEAAAMRVLCKRFDGQSSSCLAPPVFDQVRQELMAVLGEGKIGRGRDVEMLVGILEFVAKLSEKNLAVYSVSEIRQGRLKVLYDGLQTIMQIGPKIASFYLRDLVFIYGLDDLVRAGDLEYLQPIDVWVRKVAVGLGISDKEGDDDKVRRDIIEACEQCHVSALRFNQGAWYLGKNAFAIAIRRIANSAGHVEPVG